MEIKKTPSTLEEWGKYILQWAEEKGWNENLVIEREMMNFHAEITEAWEELRNGRGINEVYENVDGKPEGVPIEIADLVIRVFHTAAYQGWNLQALLERKMAYNETRPYRHGGKLA